MKYFMLIMEVNWSLRLNTYLFSQALTGSNIGYSYKPYQDYQLAIIHLLWAK